MKIIIKQFRKEYEDTWDQFVEKQSINGTFLQERRFLNYHEEGKFEDCSLMFYENDNLVAVCPACIIREEGKRQFYSHLGSSYGGIIVEKGLLRVDKMRCLYETFEEYLKEQGFQKCTLKMSMDLLCVYPQDLIKFILTYYEYRETKELNIYIDFEKYKNDILSNFSKMKKRNIRKCLQLEMQLKELNSKKEIEEFYTILSENLKKYSIKPVHNVIEMLDLKNRLGDNIAFYGVYYGNTLLAGTMVFIFKKTKCVHTQYLAADPEYAKLNAMAFVYYKMIEIYKKRAFRYLSWGITTEHGGKNINWNLANNKEEFGSLHGVNSIFEKELF